MCPRMFLFGSTALRAVHCSALHGADPAAGSSQGAVRGPVSPSPLSHISGRLIADAFNNKNVKKQLDVTCPINNMQLTGKQSGVICS